MIKHIRLMKNIKKMAFARKQLKKAYEGSKEIKEKEQFLQKERGKTGIKQNKSSKNRLKKTLDRSAMMENERKNQLEPNCQCQ